MKKIVFFVGLASLVWQSNAISVAWYRERVNQLCRYSDLIPGYVMLKSEIPQAARSNGFVHYKYKDGERITNRVNVNRYEDEGYDSFYDLNIQLFPSTGTQFNTEGPKSILSLTKANLVNLIVGMLGIDKDFRKNQKSADVFKDIQEIENLMNKTSKRETSKRADLIKEFGEKYFRIEKSVNIKNHKQAYRLGKNIVNSILLEGKTIPELFTNYLIKAYVWRVLPENDDDFSKMASKIREDSSQENYVSVLTDKIYDDIKRNTSFVPFPLNQTPITNGSAVYQGQVFPDCVETTLRQFFSTIFSKSVLKEGEYTSELDLDRIPKESSALLNFFAPGGQAGNIRKLANDPSKEIRNEWANVVSGLPFMTYKYENSKCELCGCWGNIIKVFCYLMRNYSATQGGESTPRKQAAEKRIKEINKQLESGEFVLNKDNILDIINDLIGVRTDVNLVAVENPKIERLKKFGSEEKGYDVEGCISIYPGEHKQNNVLNFHSMESHAYLGRIDMEEKIDLSNNTTGSVIEKIYINPRAALEHYPGLDFVMKMNEAAGSKVGYIRDLLRTENPPIETMGRKIFAGFSSFWDLHTAGFHKESPKQNIFDFCNFVIDHSYNAMDIALARYEMIRYYGIEPSLRKLKINQALKEASLRLLLTLRPIASNYEKIDDLIKEQLRTMETKDLIGELCGASHYTRFPRREKINSPVFGREMLDVFIPHLERVAKDKDVKFSAIEDMLYFLDMIDFEDSNPVIDNFVKHAKKRHYKIYLCNDICRSQKKLELLFPISIIDRNDIADRIFNDFKGNFTVEQASAIIEKLSEKNVESLMKRIGGNVKGKRWIVSPRGIKKLMYVLVSSYNEEDIRKKTKHIINYIREKYGERHINIVIDSVIEVLNENQSFYNLVQEIRQEMNKDIVRDLWRYI
ncbi:MAG: hypothetical protein J6T29_03680 [Alphaproteobacteria bacterium]|nr:hypothetical protein [Alphaproteobacteria bacterium]